MSELLVELQRRDVTLWRDGDNLRFSAPAGALTPELRAEMGARKAELLAQLEAASSSCDAAIPRSDRSRGAPLSFSQERLWIVDQIAPELSAYNIALCWRIKGPLDVTALEHSLQTIAERHEILRSSIVRNESGEAVQVAAPTVNRPLPIVVAAPAQLEHLASEESERPFDLSRGPLWRAVLARFGAEDHALVLTWHHLILDAWSISIFTRELAALYAAHREGKRHTLPELPIQFGDFARWQREAFAQSAARARLDYWTARLAGDRPPTALPTDRPRPAQQSFLGGERVRVLSSELAATLRQLGRSHGTTPFMLYLAAFKALLARFTGDVDLCVGSPIAQRSRPETESLIGFFLNMLALRTDLSGDPSFRALLQRVRGTVLDAFQHQDVPFEKVVETLHPTRVLGYHPIFQTAFVLQPGGDEPPVLPGLQIESVPLPVRTSKFDLTMFVADLPEGLRVKLEYSADLFDAATIDRMLESFEILLRGIADDPETPLSRLPILSAAERERLLVEWNRTARDYPQDATISALFEERAAQAPDAIALVDGDERVSYAQLNARANSIAKHLRNLGVAAGHFVGLPAERSARFIAGILGIVKAGGAYVPLDAAEPPERLATMSARCVRVLDFDALPAIHDAPNFAAPSTAADPAYVLFTSGSTGTPKGVVVPHRAISRLVINNDYAPFRSDDVAAFASNVCFDAATFEIWGALLHGATLVVTPRETLLSPDALAAHFERHRISVAFLTTSLFNRLAHESPAIFAGLRHLVFGGEAADPASVRLVLDHGKPQRLVNGYGPTEATTFAIAHNIEKIDGARIPVGRPIANTTVYLLDATQQPVPIGVAGEIHIGGPGLALNYAGLGSLTAERFLETPFGRLYRTGDLGRWLADGTIEYRGRSDAQIKLRGFRIEPAEIEAALLEVPGITDCRVVLQNDSASTPQLVAFLIPLPELRPRDEQIRAALATKLPAHMIPSAFVAVSAFPLTPNGKLDYAALPAAKVEAATTAPRTALEQEVATLWSAVLGRSDIGIHDDFFLIGGHSLLAIQLLGKLREKLGVNLPVRRLFATPTIAGVAQFIAETRDDAPTAPTLHSLVTIQPGRPDLRPFFLVPGGWGGEIEFLVYGMLKHHLGSAIPLYGLRARGSDGHTAPHESVEEMVADYVAEIRTRQPHGPYLLGGECVGGIVAYEMARRLEAEGEKVDLLVLLDTSRPSRGALRRFCADERTEARRRLWEARVRQPLRDHFRKLSELTVGDRVRYIWERSTRRRSWHAESAEDLRGEHERKLALHYPKLLLGHTVGAYGGRVTLVVPEESHRVAGNQGWDKVATGGLDVRVLPGDHVTYIRDHAASAGALLREIIENANRISS